MTPMPNCEDIFCPKCSRNRIAIQYLNDQEGYCYCWHCQYRFAVILVRSYMPESSHYRCESQPAVSPMPDQPKKWRRIKPGDPIPHGPGAEQAFPNQEAISDDAWAALGSRLYGKGGGHHG